MKIYYFISTFLIILFGVNFPTPVFSADDRNNSVSQSHKKNNGKIYITADKLTVYNDINCAEFTGKVKVVQGTTVITSNRFKIFYKKKISTNKKTSVENELINKIIALENVKIMFDNKIAKTEKVIYTVKNSLLVLSGNSSIISGDSLVTGNKITINMDNGQIEVMSSNKERIRAVLPAHVQ